MDIAEFLQMKASRKLDQYETNKKVYDGLVNLLKNHQGKKVTRRLLPKFEAILRDIYGDDLKRCYLAHSYSYQRLYYYIGDGFKPMEQHHINIGYLDLKTTREFCLTTFKDLNSNLNRIEDINKLKENLSNTYHHYLADKIRVLNTQLDEIRELCKKNDIEEWHIREAINCDNITKNYNYNLL